MMSYDPFECKTFSKRMGEDSEGENSEEDFDEMIMNTDYFQKQNKSSEPSVVCDPLMLDPTNMNENTIMLIRRIEENLSKKKDGEKLKTKSDTYSLPQSTGQCNESAPISNTNSKECIKVQQKGKREISQLISDIENEQSSVKRVCRRKRVKTKKSSKSFWSPGNVHTLSSKGTKSNPEEPSDNPAETIVNLQDPAVIEMNTNELLRSIAKDIEEYKKNDEKYEQDRVKTICKEKKVNTKSFWSPGNAQALPFQGGSTKSNPEKPGGNTAKKIGTIVDDHQDPSVMDINTNKLLRDKATDVEEYKKGEPNMPYSTVTNNVNKMEASTVKEDIRESVLQKINEEQEKSKKKSTPNNSGIKCYHCDLRFQTKNLVINHSKTVHPKTKTVGKQKKHRETAKSGKPTGNNDLKCNCNMSFKTKELLTLHLKTVHCKFEYICDICNKVFQYLNGLLNHTDAKHGDKNCLQNSNQKPKVVGKKI